VGYSYQSLDTTSDRINSNGFQGTGTYNFYRNFGADADFGAQFRHAQVNEPAKNTFSFLFGPRVSVPWSRETPFIHALFGGMTEHDRLQNRGTDFAMGFGGGLDIDAGRHLAVRAFQLDYIPRHSEELHRWDNQIRVGVGVVFK
jgi:hypothetical protein